MSIKEVYTVYQNEISLGIGVLFQVLRGKKTPTIKEIIFIIIASIIVGSMGIPVLIEFLPWEVTKNTQTLLYALAPLTAVALLGIISVYVPQVAKHAIMRAFRLENRNEDREKRNDKL